MNIQTLGPLDQKASSSLTAETRKAERHRAGRSYISHSLDSAQKVFPVGLSYVFLRWASGVSGSGAPLTAPAALTPKKTHGNVSFPFLGNII